MFDSHNIDLHLPQSWNSCTTAELEAISATIIKHSLLSTKWTPISFNDIKTELFFLLSRVKPISLINPRVAVEEQYFECEQIYPSKWAKIKEDIKVWRGFEDYRRFNIYVWQISYWMDKYMKWFDIEKGAMTLTKFPYPILKVGFRGKEFHGPDALLQNFNWQRFRFAQLYMDLYVRQENLLVKMKKHPNNFGSEQILKQCKHVDLARASFLATIFCAKTKYIDTDTEKLKPGYVYLSNQHSVNARYFRDFDVVKWQVITFWWSSMTAYLSQRFKHVYKTQNLKKDNFKKSNPLDLYIESTAALQKYLHLDEEKINKQNFYLILQQIDNMAYTNEQNEKIKSK